MTLEDNLTKLLPFILENVETINDPKDSSFGEDTAGPQYEDMSVDDGDFDCSGSESCGPCGDGSSKDEPHATGPESQAECAASAKLAESSPFDLCNKHVARLSALSDVKSKLEALPRCLVAPVLLSPVMFGLPQSRKRWYFVCACVPGLAEISSDMRAAFQSEVESIIAQMVLPVSDLMGIDSFKLAKNGPEWDYWMSPSECLKFRARAHCTCTCALRSQKKPPKAAFMYTRSDLRNLAELPTVKELPLSYTDASQSNRCPQWVRDAQNMFEQASLPFPPDAADFAPLHHEGLSP